MDKFDSKYISELMGFYKKLQSNLLVLTDSEKQKMEFELLTSELDIELKDRLRKLEIERVKNILDLSKTLSFSAKYLKFRSLENLSKHLTKFYDDNKDYFVRNISSENSKEEGLFSTEHEIKGSLDLKPHIWNLNRRILCEIKELRFSNYKREMLKIIHQSTKNIDDSLLHNYVLYRSSNDDSAYCLTEFTGQILDAIVPFLVLEQEHLDGLSKLIIHSDQGWFNSYQETWQKFIWYFLVHSELSGEKMKKMNEASGFQISANDMLPHFNSENLTIKYKGTVYKTTGTAFKNYLTVFEKTILGEGCPHRLLSFPESSYTKSFSISKTNSASNIAFKSLIIESKVKSGQSKEYWFRL